MTDRADPDDPDDQDGGPRSLIRSLLALLSEMEARGERERRGRSRLGRHTSVDYSIGIGDLTGAGGADPLEPSADEGAGAGTPTSDYHVTTREVEGGIVVAADLPGVDAGEVETRLEPEADALVVEVSGTVAARLPLESEGWTVVDDRFANGVLEVELRRD